MMIIDTAIANGIRRYAYWERGRGASPKERDLRWEIRNRALKIKHRDKKAIDPLENIGATLFMLGKVSDELDIYNGERDFAARLKKDFVQDVLRIGSVLIYQGLADSRDPLKNILYTGVVTNVNPLRVTHLESARGNVRYDEDVSKLDARMNFDTSCRAFYSPSGLC